MIAIETLAHFVRQEFGDGIGSQVENALVGKEQVSYVEAMATVDKVLASNQPRFGPCLRATNSLTRASDVEVLLPPAARPNL